jgi:uncharacterized lipoprotein YajG
MKWMILVMFVAFFAGCKAVPSTLTVSAHASQGDLIALDVTVDVKRYRFADFLFGHVSGNPQVSL